MYPWEKTTSPEPEPGIDAEAFPWDAVAEPAEVNDSKPPIELSTVEERLVEEMAAQGSWALNAPATFAYNEPEQADWRPLALVLAGATCVGALAVFVLFQPDSSTSVVTTVTSEQTTKEVRPVPAKTPSAGALIRPTDTRSVVSKTIEDGGRENPFRDALPPPPVPEEVKLIPTPAPPRPLPLPPPPPPTPVFSVVSVAVSGSSRAAMIQVSGLESTPSLHEVTIGDQVEGWSVREISTQRVLLARGKKTQSLSAQ